MDPLDVLLVYDLIFSAMSDEYSGKRAVAREGEGYMCGVGSESENIVSFSLSISAEESGESGHRAM